MDVVHAVELVADGMVAVRFRQAIEVFQGHVSPKPH